MDKTRQHFLYQQGSESVKVYSILIVHSIYIIIEVTVEKRRPYNILLHVNTT